MTDTRRMRIVVTNVFGPLNRGDHELLADLLEELRGSDVKIHGIARDPDLCRRFFPDVAFSEQIGKAASGTRIVQIGRRVALLASALASRYVPGLESLLPESQKASVRAIRDADLVIACPGGYLEDSNLSIYQSFTPLVLAALYGKRLVLAPMSIGPLRSRRLRRLGRFVLQRAEAVFVREEWSRDFVQSLGVQPVMANDLAIQRTGLRAPAARPHPRWVSATAIAWNFPQSENFERARVIYRERFVGVLKELSAATRLPIRLIVQVESDLPEIERVIEMLGGDTAIAEDTTTPDGIRQHLASSACLLASRFHSAIFALQVGCPVIALSYLPKTSGMLTMYGVPELSREIDDFDPAEVAASLLEMVEHPEVFREKSAEIQRRISGLGDPFGDYIRDVL